MLVACQFEDVFVYNGLAVAGSGGVAKTLKTLIEALSGGAIPSKDLHIAGWTIIPAAPVDLTFSLAGSAVPAAAAGGGAFPVTNTEIGFASDLETPLERVWVRAIGAGSTTATLALWCVNKRRS